MLEGKVAVVTGAGRGIGRAIAEMMAAAGAKVVVNDLGVSLQGEGASATPAEEAVAAIKAAGGEAVVNADSVSDPDSAQRIIDTAVSTFGRVDIVVNNAGILRDSIFHKLTPEDWRAVIDVHLNGTFYVSRAAAGYFREQNGGSYIHITSGTGLAGNVGQANYGAAKAGIVGLSKCIALDMGRYHVRSNCISPFAWGRMTNSIPTDTPEKAALVAKLQRATPDKNAPLAVFLGSDAAAGISGQIFGTRLNEIYLFGQSRIVRSVHHSDGWTPELVAEVAIPALESSFLPVAASTELISWDPL
jgi:NAD(P)-dependent dehydrogenase (short-subunit alcohol dehydrogenase family)